jgi:MSHA biogenesis protein MshP
VRRIAPIAAPPNSRGGGKHSVSRPQPVSRPSLASRPHPERGFALMTAIFLLVVLGAFAAFAVSFSTNTAATHALSVQGARAYEAARTGLEWATYQVKDPNGTLAPGATNLPACFASPATVALPAAMGAFTVQVTCTRHPATSATPSYHEEGNQRSAYYVFVSTATFGTVGRVDYVERRLESRVEVCKDSAAPAPTYAC